MNFSVLRASILPALLVAFTLACSTSPSGSKATAGGGTASVEFIHPEKFIDIRGSGSFASQDIEPKLTELRRFIETEATRQLPANRHLDLHITNIDEPGNVRPGGRAVRVSRTTDPAYVDVEYTLKSGNTIVRSGTATLSSSNPPSGIPTTSSSRMPLVEDAFRSWLRTVARW
ncbi:MAG: DUF3016 domain-containing protein [Verrucomicrobiales bacterium]|nr:DUF3016 domain-containing protein [Verrucomicrobiales bacterium]